MLTSSNAERQSRAIKPAHPGAVLIAIILVTIDMETAEAAAKLGIPERQLNDIINEKVPVSPQIAVRLSAMFGNSAMHWLSMQVYYDLWHAEREVDVSGIPWLRELMP